MLQQQQEWRLTLQSYSLNIFVITGEKGIPLGLNVIIQVSPDPDLCHAYLVTKNLYLEPWRK